MSFDAPGMNTPNTQIDGNEIASFMGDVIRNNLAVKAVTSETLLSSSSLINKEVIILSKYKSSFSDFVEQMLPQDFQVYMDNLMSMSVDKKRILNYGKVDMPYFLSFYKYETKRFHLAIKKNFGFMAYDRWTIPDENKGRDIIKRFEASHLNETRDRYVDEIIDYASPEAPKLRDYLNLSLYGSLPQGSGSPNLEELVVHHSLSLEVDRGAFLSPLWRMPLKYTASYMKNLM